MSAAMWARARSILCVRLDSMGDVLMMSPAIRALRNLPRVQRLSLLASREGSSIGQFIPEIDDVITYQAPWMKHSPARNSAEIDWQIVDRLRGEHFDGAVIFTTFSQSPLPAAVLCQLSEIPLRLAFCREQVYGLLSDRIPEDEPSAGIRHEVLRQLKLVETIGATTREMSLSLRSRCRDRVAVDRLLQESLPFDCTDWLVVHPGATAPSRRYPTEHFKTVVRELGEMGFSILVTGSESERELAEALSAEVPNAVKNLAGTLMLGELIALIERSPLLLTNNTGPAHIAAAVGTPVVDIYAQTNPQHTPWLVPHRLLTHDVQCRNCFKSVCPEGHHECMRSIAPDTVVSAVLDLLTETTKQTRSSDSVQSNAGLTAPFTKEQSCIRSE